MSDREYLKRAMAEVIGFAAARYLMANTAGRENGAEKAQRHLEMSKAFVRVWTGSDVRNYEMVREVHDRTAEVLTNRLDEAICFDRQRGMTEKDLVAFTERFFEVAAAVLEGEPAPEPSV